MRSAPLARLIRAFVLLPLAHASPALAQAPETAAFVTRIGTDTLYVESFRRMPGRIEGEIVVRTPYTATRRYAADLDARGRVRHFEVELQTRGGAEGLTPYRYIVRPIGDSLDVRYVRGDTVRTQRVAAPPGTLPYLRGSYALYEQAIRSWGPGGPARVELPFFPIGAENSTVLRMERQGTDQVLITEAGGPAPMRLDPQGRIVSASGADAGQRITVERVQPVDVAGLAAAFARTDRAGRGLGQLSPRDSIAARIGGAEISLAYGRPSMRGRSIMGGVVPWNRVWRTGANQATSLVTDRDLLIGGVEVPAGSYTLFTLPSESGWKLIVNRRTGQWGTVYDASQDLAHIDMRVERLDAPVERFTMALDPDGEAGRLRLEWENTRASVPIRVR